VIGGYHGYLQEFSRGLCIEERQGNLLGTEWTPVCQLNRDTTPPHISDSGPAKKEELREKWISFRKEKLSFSFIESA
jgi:hypothetical protein